MNIEPAMALDVSTRLAACGSLVSSLEMLAVRCEFRDSGVFNLRGVASLYWSAGRLEAVDRRITGVLAVLVFSSATLMLLGPYSLGGRVAITVSCIARNLVRWRRLLGGDGAEQLTTLVLTATLLAVLPLPSSTRIHLAVSFIGLQLMLSYVTAGVAKLRSPVWRGGAALPDIMSTETHGHPAVAAVLRRFRRGAVVAGWSVMVFESAFPLFLLGPHWLAIVALGLGLGFHVACAATMGLNSFLWAFPATYPCVLVVGKWLSPFW